MPRLWWYFYCNFNSSRPANLNIDDGFFANVQEPAGDENDDYSHRFSQVVDTVNHRKPPHGGVKGDWTIADRIQDHRPHRCDSQAIGHLLVNAASCVAFRPSLQISGGTMTNADEFRRTFRKNNKDARSSRICGNLTNVFALNVFWTAKRNHSYNTIMFIT